MEVTYKKVKKLSIADRAYIAGLIDGEGTVTLTSKRKNAFRCLAVTISNTDYELLNWVATIVGAGIITTKVTYKNNHSQSYTYQVYSR